MRDERNEGAAERGKLKVSAIKTVRFAALVAAGGKPEVYLPLFDPMQDRAFVDAAKENRVLSIRQEPASKKADFGIVGYDEQKRTTYLVFPKSLRRFANARVIGIKYNVVGASALSPIDVPASAMRPHVAATAPKRNEAKAAPRALRPLRPVRPAPQPKKQAPKKLEPQPKEFRVTVRVKTVSEKDLMVTALTKREAKEKAEALSAGEGRQVTAVAVVIAT